MKEKDSSLWFVNSLCLLMKIYNLVSHFATLMKQRYTHIHKVWHYNGMPMLLLKKNQCLQKYRDIIFPSEKEQEPSYSVVECTAHKS